MLAGSCATMKFSNGVKDYETFSELMQLSLREIALFSQPEIRYEFNEMLISD